MHTPSPSRLRLVPTPLGLVAGLDLGDLGNHELDDAEESVVDAEFIVLEDELSLARPPAVIDRARALAARLLRVPNPHRTTVLETIAEARTEQRGAVDAAFAAWEAALPRQEERGVADLNQSSTSLSNDH